MLCMKRRRFNPTTCFQARPPFAREPIVLCSPALLQTRVVLQLVALRCCPSQPWEVSFPTLRDHHPDYNRNEMNLLCNLWLFTPSFLARSNQNRLSCDKQPLLRFPKTAPSSTTSYESTPTPQFPGKLWQKALQLLSLVPPLRFHTSSTVYASYALPVCCTWLSILGFTAFHLPRSKIPAVFFPPFEAFHPLAASPHQVALL